MRKFDPDSIDHRSPALIRRLIPPIGRVLRWYFRASVAGIERVPPGPALFVGNHNMIVYTLDTGILFGALYQHHGLEALPYGLQHDFGVSVPVLRTLAGWAGGIRASHENAHRVFAAGMKVLTRRRTRLLQALPPPRQNRLWRPGGLHQAGAEGERAHRAGGDSRGAVGVLHRL